MRAGAGPALPDKHSARHEQVTMSDCINWTGATFTSHGNTYGRTGNRLAHRQAYTRAKGQIPAGMVIDHLCRNGLCVNPEHLEAVSNTVNIMRGEGQPAKNARKTHCWRGHELTPDNTWNKRGRRACRQCDIERYHSAEYLAHQRERRRR